MIKKTILTTLLSCSMALVAGAKEPEKKADYLASKKKHIESRGNSYDAQQWSDHFDAQDLNKDGLLSCGGKVCLQDVAKSCKECRKEGAQKRFKTGEDFAHCHCRNTTSNSKTPSD